MPFSLYFSIKGCDIVSCKLIVQKLEVRTSNLESWRLKTWNLEVSNTPSGVSPHFKQLLQPWCDDELAAGDEQAIRKQDERALHCETPTKNMTTKDPGDILGAPGHNEFNKSRAVNYLGTTNPLRQEL